MSNKPYNNFVKASSNDPTTATTSVIHFKPKLSGDEAQRIYLEEIKESTSRGQPYIPACTHKERIHIKVNQEDINEKDLFISAQNDDVTTLRNALDAFPDNLNATDDYGWSLLMIACQANSIEAVQELLKRGIDVSIRDKAGNSARSLVIKNKNLVLADLLLNHNKPEKHRRAEPQEKSNNSYSHSSYKDERNTVYKDKNQSKYVCELCNAEYTNKEDHLSSTIHNINASKGKKIPPNYVIPQSNKGYQIMLKVGWDRETGLGKYGSGKKYPIKAVEKKDRRGLGHEERKKVEVKETVKLKNKKHVDMDKRRSRRFERDFRREFY